MGAAMQNRVRQIPHPPARQRRHRRSAESGVLPPGKTKARTHQRQEVVANEPVEEPDGSPARGIKPVVPTEPTCLQSLPSQREPGEALELSLRRRDVQLPAQVDGPTEVATANAVRGTRRHVVEASGGNPELLQDQGSLRSGRGTQWKHSDADQSWPWL